MTPPLVSVLMAVHNGQGFLPEALDSIAAQTLRDHELVVVDDGSTDATPALLQAAAARDPRVRILRNPANLGLTRSLNVGLAQCCGRYVARLDADDLALPQRLEVQAGFLDAHPDHVLVGARELVIDAAGKVQREGRGGLGWQAFRYLSFFMPPIVHSSAMFRRAALVQHGLRYDERLRSAQDFAMWQALQAPGRAARLDEPLVLLREHQGSISAMRREEQADTAIAIATGALARGFPHRAAPALEQLCAFIIAGRGAGTARLDRLAALALELEADFLRALPCDAATVRIIRGLTVNQLLKGAHRAGLLLPMTRTLLARRPLETAAELLAIARRRRPAAQPGARVAA